MLLAKSCVRATIAIPNHGQARPVIIMLMMDSPNALWGDAVYPVIDRDI